MSGQIITLIDVWAEDEMHLVFECDAYDTIRRGSNFTALFSGVADNDMKGFFSRPALQSLLADYIRAVCMKRKQLTTVVAPVLT